MKLIVLLNLILLWAQCAHSSKSTAFDQSAQINPADSMKYIQLIGPFINDSLILHDDLLIEIASSFLGSPYSGATLEINPTEQLVVNLREFDCTTFIETVIALYLTVKYNDCGIESYCKYLQQIRYRDGIISDYTDRLHYLSEWITENEKNGLISNITCETEGEKFSPQLNYMSAHPNFYRQLSDDSALVNKMAQIEKHISKGKGCFIPKEKIENIENQLKEGMIAAITTNISGLDFVHAGFLVKVGSRIHLLHASSDEKKVVISKLPVSDYLMGNRRQTGIVVLELNR